MTSGFTSLLFALGVGMWVYSKLMHNTNNSRSSLTGAGVAAGIAFLVFFTLFKGVLHL